MALIYLQGGTEHTLINAVRETHYRQFQATDWTDLRVGFFLSLTTALADDTQAGIAEEIGTPPRPILEWTDRVIIGLTNRAAGDIFCGYTNLHGNRIRSIGTSSLVSSDVGIGTTNTRYWRPKNELSNNDAVAIIDNGVVRARAGDGSQMHFVQDSATAGGYCTLFMLRFRRDNATSRARIITMEVKKATSSGHSSDILFTTTPTLTILEAQLEAFPTSVNTLGPVELSQVPDTFYFYWPFSSSRLRIHALGILKQA